MGEEALQPPAQFSMITSPQTLDLLCQVLEVQRLDLALAEQGRLLLRPQVEVGVILRGLGAHGMSPLPPVWPRAAVLATAAPRTCPDGCASACLTPFSATPWEEWGARGVSYQRDKRLQAVIAISVPP